MPAAAKIEKGGPFCIGNKGVCIEHFVVCVKGILEDGDNLNRAQPGKGQDDSEDDDVGLQEA